PTSHFAPSGFFWRLDPQAPTDDYDQLAGEWTGDQIQTTRTYSANGWVRGINSKRGATTIQNLQFQVDMQGNILARQDLTRSRSDTISLIVSGVRSWARARAAPRSSTSPAPCRAAPPRTRPTATTPSAA